MYVECMDSQKVLVGAVVLGPIILLVLVGLSLSLSAW